MASEDWPPLISVARITPSALPEMKVGESQRQLIRHVGHD
jgi:hypothetical protein